jgi:YYY domain-containing protein
MVCEPAEWRTGVRVKPSPSKQGARTPRLGSGRSRGTDPSPVPPADPAPEAPESAARFRSALARVPWFGLGLAAIALVALALRLYGLNWDANNHLHPDEREIVFKAMCLSFPAQAALRPGNCDPAVTGPGWFFSPNSPLNPHFFAYGTFPLYLLAAVYHTLAWLTHATGGRFVPPGGGAWDDFDHVTLVGRALSALFDTGSVVLVGLLGRRLSRPWVGLLAAGLVAVLPFEVQVAHFYAVDTVLAFFVLLTLLASVRLAQGQRTRLGVFPWGVWGDGLLVGLALGLAIATKVSALPLVAPVGLAVVLRWRRAGADDALLAVLGIAAAAILAFAVTSPYALIDWHTFRTQINEQTALSQGKLDYPYVRQFAGLTPYVYQIQQLLLYDMGLLPGLLALAGAGWAAWRVWRRWDDDWLVIVSWLIVYFAVIGSAYTKFTRYMLPIFPLLALCGAAALVALAASGERWLAVHAAGPPAQTGGRMRDWAGMRALRSLTAVYGTRWWRVAIAAIGLTVLATSAFLALALDNIYSAPNTRVQASEWIYDHVAPGATVTNEVWDDPLPILVPPARPGSGLGLTAAGHPIAPGEYTPIPLNLYDADTSQKADELSQNLASADVVVLSSQRLVRSIPKLPDRYPMTTRYYQLLFSGQLGFTLAAHFENPPHLLGWTLQDSGADESFSVYDHPPVWIFMRHGPPVSAAALRALLTAGITLTATSSRAGNQKSLLLSPQDLAADAQSPALGVQFPLDSLANRVPLVWWLLVVELLGLVSFPLTYFAFPGLRDRGWGLSKLVGLLALAYAIWLPASLRLLPFTEGTVYLMSALLVIAGATLAWWRRAELWGFVRARWRLLAVCEGGFLAAFGFFTWVRALDPDLWHIWRGGEKPMELAFLNGILHSQYFPPLDPWFSGGHINYYYYGQYLIAVLIRLTGVAPTTAFNLAIPLLFGITFTAAFSVVAGITGRWWAGLLGGVALVVVGNLDGLWQALGQWGALLAHLPPLPFDYWQSSRVIPFTINEFPYWSFLYADLHPHLIDLPVVVLLVAVCASLLAGPRCPWRTTLPTLAVAMLALGATGAINTWDFPTAALLLAVVLTLRALGVGEGSGWRAIFARVRWPVVRRLGLTIVLVVGGAFLLYLPFYAHFQTFVSGTGQVTTATNPGQFVTLFGIWLFLLASFFVVELRDRWERYLASHGAGDVAGASGRTWMVAVVAVVVLALLYAAGVKALLVGLIVMGLFLALDPRHSPTKLLTYALLLLGLVIALGVEIIYVRDFLDNSDWERMNTVFKFYYQVWVCFALGGALAFSQLAPRLFPAPEPSDADDLRSSDPTLALASVGPLPTPAGRSAKEENASGLAPSDEPASAGESAAPTLKRGPATVGGASAWSYFSGGGSSLLRGAWLITLVSLLVGSLVFLVEGTAARVRDPALWAQVQPPPGGIQPQGLSLDGMAYMQGWYPGDYAAITWLNAHISGIPTLMVMSSDPYHVHVSDYTGLPSVVVVGHEPEQRYPDEVSARQSDVQLFFTTVDPQAALDILHRYGVQLVYVGVQERSCTTTDAAGKCVPAASAAVQKYDTLVQMGALAPIYRNADVTIYEVMR